MLNNTLVAKLMTHYPFCITEDWTLTEVAIKMKEINTGVFPVVEGKKNKETQKPIGVLTDRDIIVRGLGLGTPLTDMRVSDVYTREPICCHEDDSLAKAYRTLRENKIGRLLVKNEQGDLVGIISLADILSSVPEEQWMGSEHAGTAVQARKAAGA